MLIKFESKDSASFVMMSDMAKQLLAMMGQDKKLEGSISGAAIAEAIVNLDKALSQRAGTEAEPQDEDAEQEFVSLAVRAAPLRELLRKAKEADSYLMWRPE